MAKKPTAHTVKVLIIDDDAFLTDIYATQLDLEGFSVISANDGEEGIKMTRKEMPDAILLDVRMPKLDGLATLQRLKEDEKTKAIPVIMLSNSGEKKDIDKAFAGGAADYLIKVHFAPAETVTKIRKVLEGARARG